VYEKLLVVAARGTDAKDDQASIFSTQSYLRRRQHRYVEALSLSNRAVALNASDYYLVTRALINEDQGNYNAALADFDRALAQGNGPYWYYHRRSRAHTAAGHTEAAIADASQSIKLNSKDPDGLVMRADAEMKADRDQEALVDYSKALEMEPACPQALGGRAALYEKNGEHQKAIDDATKALKSGHLKPARHFDDDYKIDVAGGKMPLTIVTYQIRCKAYKALEKGAQAAIDAAAATKGEQEWRRFINLIAN